MCLLQALAGAEEETATISDALKLSCLCLGSLGSRIAVFSNRLYAYVTTFGRHVRRLRVLELWLPSRE